MNETIPLSLWGIVMMILTSVNINIPNVQDDINKCKY